MNKYQIIEKIAKDRLVEHIVKRKTDEHVDDLSQDIYEILLDKPASLIEQLYERGELQYYIGRVAHNNIFSTTSGYYRTYKKPEQHIKIDDLNI